MDNARTGHPEAGQAVAERNYRDETDDDDAPSDATLKFEGKMGVSEDDRGGDPYNHTGRFKRSVR